MAFGDYMKGILTIDDPRGQYMGMQSIARLSLTGKNIDISYLGPAEHPTAVVLRLTPKTDKEYEQEELNRYQTEEDKERVRQKYRDLRRIVQYIKADYFYTADPEQFRVFLSYATTRLNFCKYCKVYDGRYDVYYHCGRSNECTEEEFYNGTVDFSYNPYKNR